MLQGAVWHSVSEQETKSLTLFLSVSDMTWVVLQEVVTLKTDMVQDATANILELHSIPAAVSKDLAAVVSEEQSNNSSELTEDTAGALQA